MMLNIGAQIVLAKGKKDAVELGLQMAKMYDELERELTRTKRALWLARVDRANAKVELFENRFWNAVLNRKSDADKKFECMYERELKKWQNIEQKCLKYADKFKEEK